MKETIIATLIGTVIGGVITFLVAMIYYKKASKELKKEANELRRLNRIMLQGLENAGWLELLRDSEGSIEGFRKTTTGAIHFEGDLKTKKIPRNSE